LDPGVRQASAWSVGQLRGSAIAGIADLGRFVRVDASVEGETIA